jgi:D-glycero-D-manno-heptose 1,7-bisphosphate phosphatase
MGSDAVSQLRRAVFLDRDGVLNRAVVRQGRPYPPASAAELDIVPGVRECLLALKRLGFLLIVVTNQPDVARGTQTLERVEEINAALRAALPLDDVLACFHDDADGCACRKPRPGLLLEAARRHGIDLAGSFMVGDRWRDVEAGAAAGCRTVWIECGYSERAPGVGPDCRVGLLEEAVGWIAAGTEAGAGSAEQNGEVDTQHGVY